MARLGLPALGRTTGAKHRLQTVLLVALLGLGVSASVGTAEANAATVCTGDVCVIVPDATITTPLGVVTITVATGNVVTVQLTRTLANTLLVGIPFSLPTGLAVSGCPGGCSRTTASVQTAAGLVRIDTVQIPPGPPARFTIPNLTLISIHPPGPCRVTTTTTTVVFTPIIPPGPPA